VGNASGAAGGGIFTSAPVTIEESVVSGNTSGTSGGGIFSTAAVNMSETTVGSASSVPFLNDTALTANGNEASLNGGGFFDTGLHTTTISKSAISGNTATYGGGIAGRAQVELNITNTTISGNRATVGAGVTTNGAATVLSSSIADNNNSVNTPGAGLNTYGLGTYTLGNTLLEYNMLPNGLFANCDCGHGNFDCPQIKSLGYNLENCQSCGFTGETDRIDTYPLLKPLANNGGLTETRAIPSIAAGDAEDSPAVDTGDPDNCPTTDQRGVIRPADGNGDSNFVCDVGALELSFGETTDLNISNISASTDRAGLNETVTVTATIVNPAGASANADNVEVTATVPEGFSDASATLNDGTADNSCSVDATAVSCPAIASMTPGQEATLTISATTASEGTHTIDVSAASASDPVPANNNASVSITVMGSSDIALEASADNTNVQTGSNVTITVTATNNGPDDATGLRLGGSVPQGFELVDVTPQSGTCNNANSDLNCAMDTLSASTSATVQVVLRALQAGTHTFSGQLAADQNDSDPGNNSATLTLTVTGEDVSPTPTPTPTPGGGSSDDGGGSSGCTLGPNTGFDPTLPLALLASILYIARRRRLTPEDHRR
jgi:uncharacterized repeat protein (TIGR01451 family)